MRKRIATVATLIALAASAVAVAGSYESLSETDQRRLCNAYATQAGMFARGREAGVSLESHLKAAAAACQKRPSSRSACKDFPALAAEVHAGKWTVEEAGKKVRADCKHYISE